MYLDANGNLYVTGSVTASSGFTIASTNKSGGTVTARSLVILDTSNNSAFTTTTTAYARGVYGVMMGVEVNGDTNSDGVCNSNETCRVAVGGEVEVLLTNASTAVKGDYVFTTSTAGSGVSSAKQFDGLIGVVSNLAGSGSGYVKMILKPQTQVSGSPFLETSNTALADGSYVEIVHNTNSANVVANGWVYDGTNWRQVDVTDNEQATASATVNFNTEANYSQENMAYSVTLTPSATSGDITLTLGSGTWNSDARVKAGTRVTGNGGVATITGTPAAQTTIAATTSTNFTNTSAIASGSWYLYGTTFDGSVGKINSYTSSDVGTFSTTSQGQLPQSLRQHSSVTASIGGTQYFYVIGGYNAAYLSTVYKATIDSSGNVGAFTTTSQGQLPQGIASPKAVTAAIGGTQYLYVTAGEKGAYLSTVYKATIDSSGNVGAFATTSQGQLPATIFEHSTVTAAIGGTQYIYVTGGNDGVVGTVSTVYKATIDSSGNVGTFATTSQGQLPQNLRELDTVTAAIGGTQYIYVTGGANVSTVYKTTIDSSGNVGIFSTTSQGQLPATRSEHSTVTASIGGTQYIYVTGGTGLVSTVYKATIPGTSAPTSTVYSVATAGDQINTSSFADIDDVDVTETLNSQTIQYGVSFDGRTTFYIYDSTASNNGWRPIARNNSGTWQYNANTSAGVDKVTWTSATYNSQNGALSQAFGVTQNQMSGTTLGGLTDLNWNEINGFGPLTTTLDFAAGLKTTSASQIPQVDQIQVKYTKAGMKIVMTDSNTVRMYNYTGVTRNVKLNVIPPGGGGSPGAGAGLYTNNSSSVANGSYVEVAHNQNTTDYLANSWKYNTATSKWEQIDVKNSEQATNSAQVNFNTEANYSQENMAYSVTLTPSATSGDITLTLGSGTWNSDARIKAGTRVTGNGGVATITGTPAAQTTIAATTSTNFTNTNAIASGSWYLYGTTFDGSVGKINSTTVYNSNVGTFSTTSQAQFPATLSDPPGVATTSIGGTQYVYVVGGGTPTAISTVYKATIDSSANVGTFATTSQAQLPQALIQEYTFITTVGGTQYLYAIGGYNGSVRVSTVYKATIDSSGNLGTFSTTSQGQLPQILATNYSVNTATIGGTQYVYVVGGSGNGDAAQSTVYKATIDTSGNIGTFSTTSQGQLPEALKGLNTSTVSIGGTQYLYVISGADDPGNRKSTVYKATIDSSGNVGTFSTTSQAQLPQTIMSSVSVTNSIGGTQYVYVMGGNSPTSLSTVYKATIDSSANVGTFATTSQAQLPQVLSGSHRVITASIGGTQYVYVIAGVATSTVYKATIGPDTLAAPTSTSYSVATAGDQITTSSWDNIDSVVVTETLNSQTINYSVSFDGRTTFYIYDSTTSNNGWRPIARNNSGTWQYNSNTTAGVSNVTWTSATYNSQNGAISQAAGVTQDQMTGTQLAAVTALQWREINGFTPTTNTLDFAAALKTTSASQIPQVDQIKVNYTQAGYKIVQQDANTARLYNYSGAAQNLRLDVITGGLGRNAGTVSLAPAAADTQAQDNTNAIWINQTGVNGALLKLQRGGTDIFKLQQNAGDAAMILDQRLSGDILTASASGTTKMVLTNAGNLGLGTSSPNSKLHAVTDDATNNSITDVLTLTHTTSGTATRNFSPNTNGTLDTSLTAYWKLDETAGTRYDSVGINNLTDNATVTSNPGKKGTAGQFTAVNSEYLSIADNANISVGDIDFTWAAWVYRDATGVEHMILGQGTNDNDSSYLMKVLNTDKARFSVFDTGNIENVVNSTGTLAANQWYFIVGWHDSVNNTINVQINNGAVDSVAYTLGGRDVATELRIGRYGTGYMNGRIDEVGFWKKVLTAQERTDLYNSGNGNTYNNTGIGTGLLFQAEDAAGTTQNAGRISGILATSDTASVTGQSALTFDTRGITYNSDVGTFATTSQGQLPQINHRQGVVTATIGGTQYMYVMGGLSGATVVSTVYKTTIDSSGNIGAFATTSQAQLPQTLYDLSTVTASIGGTQYIYVTGGYTGAAVVSTVYKATIDSSGNVGAFSTTSQGQLIQTNYRHNAVTASIGGTQYLYVMGGDVGTGSSVYKATIDSSGNVGAFSTTSQGQLFSILRDFSSVTASIGGTQYLYVMGGNNGGATTYSTVYRATINSSGNIGTFATTSQSQLLQIVYGPSASTASIGGTQYIYFSGGNSGGTISTLYKTTIDSSGNVGTFSTTSQGQLPTGRMYHPTVITPTGSTQYFYIVGGDAGAGTGLSSVYKATIGPDTGSSTLTRRMKLDHVGNLTISGTITQSGSPDIAENILVTDPTIEAGDVVMIDPDYQGSAPYNKAAAKKADQPYSKTILGIISTDPGIILNASKNVVIDDKRSQENERPLVLAGRVPVKIDPDSDPIAVGDVLTASTKPGYAIKATKAGYTIGKALEEWTGQDRILVMVQYGYQTGDLSPKEFFKTITNASSSAITSLATQGDSTQSASLSGLLTQTPDLLSSTATWIKDRWETLGKTNTDLISSLWVKTGILSVDLVDAGKLTIGGKTLAEYIREIIQGEQTTNNKQQTTILSPIASESALLRYGYGGQAGIAVELGPTQTFGIYNKEGSPAAVFDGKGNATISGSLTASSVQANQASFSGTLYADRIVTRFGDLDERLAGLIEATQSAVPLGFNPANAGLNPQETTLDATSSALLALLLNSPVAPSYFKRGAGGVTGGEGELLIDGTILIDKTGISTISDTLYIQPAKLGNLDIMGGTIVINTLGDVVINGNLAVIGNLSIGGHVQAGTLNVAGVLGTNVIRPINGFGDLIFDATGSARFAGDVIASGSGVFKKLVIASEAKQSLGIATGSASPRNDTSAGLSILPAGEDSVTIPNTLVTDQSLIYMTPVSSTANQVLYIYNKEARTSFTVAVDQALPKDIEFNWWIIN